MGNHLVATAFHHHRHRAVTVHLASALQVWVSDASTTSESLTRRALTRMGDTQLTPPRERPGLDIHTRPASATNHFRSSCRCPGHPGSGVDKLTVTPS